MAHLCMRRALPMGAACLMLASAVPLMGCSSKPAADATPATPGASSTPAPTADAPVLQSPTTPTIAALEIPGTIKGEIARRAFAVGHSTIKTGKQVELGGKEWMATTMCQGDGELEYTILLDGKTTSSARYRCQEQKDIITNTAISGTRGKHDVDIQISLMGQLDALYVIVAPSGTF